MYDSIAGMNCWDLATSFTSYIDRHYKNFETFICVGEEGGHFCPVVKYDNLMYVVDFTYNNQHQFDEPVLIFKKGMETNYGEKMTRIYTIEQAQKAAPSDLESLEDLDEEYDEIFKSAYYG